MADKIQMRGDTAANWKTYNPILADREWGLETDTKKCKIGNGVTVWNTLDYISLGGDAINIGYTFSNGQLEANCDDWNLYADAAGSTPVDGTGGTATITKAWNGTNPLNGKGDMIITKPASNCQGNGASKDFTIDSGQLGKVTQIDFDYLVPSAYVSGYANVSVYDVTNAKFCPVTVSDIAASFGSIARHSFLFIPNANSKNYRLCIHIADSTSTAWTLEVDNFQIGNWKTFSAPVVTPWVDYTPVFTGFGTVTINKAQWKRDGEDILLSIKIVVGTPTSVEAQMTLPSVYTSRANVPTLEKVGYGVVSLSAASQFVVLSEPSKNYVTFGAQAASFAGLSKMNGSPLVVAGEVFSFDARIPCAQFSVNSTFVGVNEPFYLSNSETVANTNGVVGKTKLGIDGSPILALTAATYFDMALPRKLLPNEIIQVQVRSKVDGNWVNVEQAGTSQTASLVGFPSPTVANQHYGIGAVKINSGQIRVRFNSHASINYGPTSVTWATLIGYADGYDAWRVRIGQASTGAEIANNGNIRASATVLATSNGSAPSILYSANIASVVRTAVGRFTVTFITPMPHANYCVLSSCDWGTGESGNIIEVDKLVTKTVNGFGIVMGVPGTYNQTTLSPIDTASTVSLTIVC